MSRSAFIHEGVEYPFPEVIKTLGRPLNQLEKLMLRKARQAYSSGMFTGSIGRFMADPSAPSAWRAGSAELRLAIYRTIYPKDTLVKWAGIPAKPRWLAQAYQEEVCGHLLASNFQPQKDDE